jgi:hypothetical protein
MKQKMKKLFIKRQIIMKIYLSITLVLFSILGVKAHENPENLKFTLSEKINIEYSLNGNEALKIQNSFGNVDINIGKTNQFKAEISIKVSANSKEEAQEMLNKIKILKSKIGDQIDIKTHFERPSYKINDGKNLKYTIDYTVSMPANMPLELSNSYGDVSLPSFQAPLALNLNYGNIIAKNINHKQSQININYGESQFEKISDANVNLNYSKMMVNELRRVKLNDNYGELRAKVIADLNAHFNYTEGFIETIKEGLTVKANYAFPLKIKAIDPNTREIRIVSNYTDVALPTQNMDATFEIKTQNGQLNVAKGSEVFFFNSSKTTGSQPKIYKGTIGDQKESKTKIVVITNYSDVDLKPE